MPDIDNGKKVWFISGQFGEDLEGVFSTQALALEYLRVVSVASYTTLYCYERELDPVAVPPILTINFVMLDGKWNASEFIKSFNNIGIVMADSKNISVSFVPVNLENIKEEAFAILHANGYQDLSLAESFGIEEE